MNKKIIAVSFLIVAILFVSAIAGTIFYYNNKVSNLNSQISNLKAQLKKLTTANLTTALGIAEVIPNNSGNKGNPTKFNNLYITGSVANTGQSTAYNAGLHVVAYDAIGKVEINMTVPMDYDATFGTDAATNAYVSSIYQTSLLQLGNLYSEQNVSIAIAIYHEGTVTNWTVTPVWTNTP